jgi:hypothetical protein
MVTEDTLFAQYTEQMRYHDGKVGDGFGTFLRLFSAIVGGAIWLRLQSGFSGSSLHYEMLSDVLVGLVFLQSWLTVREHSRAYYDNKTLRSELIKSSPHHAKRRKILGLTERGMVFSMLVATALFFAANPFSNPIWLDRLRQLLPW